MIGQLANTYEQLVEVITRFPIVSPRISAAAIEI